MEHKIVFLGGGNMAEGIINGFISNGNVSPANITVKEPVDARRAYLTEKYGISASVDPADEVRNADILIIAVVPKFVSDVTAYLAPLVNEKQIIISIAAATKIEKIAQTLGADKKIIRMTPNTMIATQSGYSAMCFNANCTAEDKETAKSYVQYLGQIQEISEDLFNAFTSYCNVGPLFCYQLMEALTDAGVYVGFPRAVAKDMAVKNMLGAAKLIDATGLEPSAKTEMMTSPAGVTIESLRALKQTGFQSSVMESVIAGFNKTNSL